MEKNQFKRTFTRAEVEEYVKKMLSSSEVTMCEQKDRIVWSNKVNIQLINIFFVPKILFSIVLFWLFLLNRSSNVLSNDVMSSIFSYNTLNNHFQIINIVLIKD